MVRLTVAELFCGAGGASVGLHAAGLDHVAAVDFDADAIACLSFCMGDGLFARPHPALGAYPGVARLQEVQRWSPVAADMWWGSPPCQSFSAAGNRLGPGDSRNGFPHVFAALDEALVLLDGSFPTWLVFENVRGMLSHKGTGCDDTCPGCYFRIVLEEVDTRFPCVSWFVLDAADFGVPQRRRRVFIVGGPVPVVAPTPTHSREALEAAKADGSYWRAVELGDWAELPPGEHGRPWRTMRQALQLPLGVGVIGGGTNPHGPDREAERTYRELTDEPSTTLAAKEKGGNRGPWLFESGQNTTDSNGTRPHRSSLDDPAPTVRRDPGRLSQSQRVEDLDDPAHTLDAGGTAGGYRTPQVDETETPDWWHRATDPDEPSRTVGSRANASILLDKPSPAVTATEAKGCCDGAEHKLQRASDALRLATGRRRLTVRECLIIQGMPEDWPLQGTSEARFTAVGNMVPPALAAAVAGAILDAAARAVVPVPHQPSSAANKSSSPTSGPAALLPGD